MSRRIEMYRNLVATYGEDADKYKEAIAKDNAEIAELEDRLVRLRAVVAKNSNRLANTIHELQAIRTLVREIDDADKSEARADEDAQAAAQREREDYGLA